MLLQISWTCICRKMQLWTSFCFTGFAFAWLLLFSFILIQCEFSRQMLFIHLYYIICLFICKGFWYFAWPRSYEIREIPQNWQNTRTLRHSPEILPNTCRYNIFEIYRGYWGCLLALNLKIYLEISSLHAQEVRRLFFDTIRIVKYCL